MLDLTCSHAAAGLCPACRADYDEDPTAWVEFGDHPQGIANWAALEQEMNDWRAERAALPPAAADTSDIPF